MGVGWRKLAPLWALAIGLACAQHTGGAQGGSVEPGYEHPDRPLIPQGPGDHPLLGVTILPPLRTTPMVRALNPAHNGRVCSTWGDFHYKTFDGDVFRFPGRCNYVFSAHCGATYEDFNIQLRRGQGPSATMPSRVTMKLNGVVIELTKDSVLVNGRPIQLPFSRSGVLVEQSSNYLKVVARLGLVFMWNQDDSLLLELDTKYANQTCGLCGDFNGVPIFNEFFSHNAKLTPIEFGNLQKMDGPMEQCQDPVLPAPPMNCSTGSGICEEILSAELFMGCHPLVDASRYVDACQQDLCLCEHGDLTSCICHTLAEYSRQCAHAGGLPSDWRGPDLCPQTCPLNMQYRECGSPCADTCSNLEHSQLCEDHCVAGCFCPAGMVLDDINQTGCIPVSQCPCVLNGVTYASGAVYSTDCTNCTCFGGQWSCQEVPCPGTCSVLGGAHFSTFDERPYTVHGDCSYVLAKPCDSSAFTVLAELRRCGLTDSESCLRSLTLSLGGGQTVVTVKASGEVFVNQIYTQLPVSAANITLFRPSTFFIIAQTNLGLQVDIQLAPIMQVFVRLAPEFRGLTCGLCGNFNQNQADDFRTLSGVVEGTAAAFANTWKTQASCPNVKNSFEDPCSLSVENEKFAQHWCLRLTDPQGPFAQCHATVIPGTYYSNCLFDTCNCEKSEDCLCAALSSYVRACAAKGVLLSGWRDGVCTKPMDTCPKSMTYHYHISSCQPTCRSRSAQDATCGVSFVPVDGCTCPQGTFLDDTGKCVPATSCPCYHGDTVIPNGESLHERGAVCTCTQGTLTCIGGHTPAPVCAAPMVYFDCRNATPGDTGAGCQKSCHTLDMDCYSPQCVPGCVCPDGLVADGEGGCIASADCPCVHNEASYQAGQTIRVGCNTCTCKSRMWQCTDKPCLTTCAVYGDGHYLTFDGQRYSFNGDCEYTLVQNHCGGNGSAQDAFRVVTENVPCGTTGTTCSKAIKIFLGSYELKLSDGKVEVIEKGAGQEVPYSVRQAGIYLVVHTSAGLTLLWDKKTSIFLRLGPEFKGRVCGLCGNFDDNAVNDFTTRSRSVVGDVLEFGNSWKFSPSCPDAPAPRDPCTANPYRRSWAQKQCSLINSATFAACHAHVEPTKYYEACVSDACACDSGGDCECFCTAVAAYAQACHEVGVCVSWRTPDICPLFCDYYNPEGECEWHYQPCGAPCLRTCQNPRGQCLQDTQGLEGCYPKCPPEAPIFDEDQMQCVATCPLPTPPPPCQVRGKTYLPGAVVPSDENCHSCVCTESGVQCTYDTEACVCIYDGQRFHPGDVIYHTTDGTGGCISAHCGANGTIERRVHTCSPTTSPPETTFSFSTPPIVVSTTGLPGTQPSPSTSQAHTGTPSRALSTATDTSPWPTPSTASVSPHPGCGEECQWSLWLDISRPGRGIDSGDFDTLDNLRAHGYQVCQAPRAVECRAEDAPEVPLQVLGQRVECNPTVGLTCYNRDQVSRLCDNYQIRILCCSPRACPTSRGPAQATSPTTYRTTETGSTPGTTTTPTPVTSTPTPVTTTTPAPGTSTPIPGTTTTPTPGTTTTPTPGTTTTPTPGTTTPTPGTTTTPVPVTTTTPTPVITTTPTPVTTTTPTPVTTTTPTPVTTTTPTPVITTTPTPVTTTTPTTPVITTTPTTPVTTTTPTPVTTTTPTPGTTTTPTPVTTTTPTPGTTTPTPVTTTTPTPVTTTTPTPVTTTTPTPVTTTTPTPVITTTPTPVTTTTPTTPVITTTPTTPVTTTTPTPVTTTTPTPGTTTTPTPVTTTTPTPGTTTPTPVTTTTPTPVITTTPTPVITTTPTTPVITTTPTPGTTTPTPVITTTPTTPVTTTTPTPVTTTTPTPVITTTPTPGTTTTPTPVTTTTPTPGTTTTPTPGTTTTPTPVTTTTPTPVTTTTPTPGTTTPTPGTTTPAPETSTTVKTTLLTPSLTPVSTTASTITSVSITTLETSHVPGELTSPEPSEISCLRESCSWTDWIDGSYPQPDINSGDFDTFQNLRSKGYKFCKSPNKVECRAQRFPNTPLAELGQDVICSDTVGLICLNRNQLPPICYNYQVRIQCCEWVDVCRVRTTSPATSGATHSTTNEARTQTRATRTTEIPWTSAQHSSASSTHVLPATTIIPSTHVVTTPGTTTCQPQCTWTRWFDVDFPSPGPHGGDLETYSNIVRSGERICRRPEYITHLECRAENHPDVSIERLGQVVQCNPDVGLVCHNRDQEGKFQMCFNYEVRVLCCEPRAGCPTFQPVTVPSTPSVSITSPTETTFHVGTSKTTPVPKTSATSVPATSTTSTTTTTPSPVPATETTRPTPGTTTCQPQCTWTRWFDVDFPSPGPHGGDLETYSNIVRSGERICRRPEYITHLECRAENHPDVSIERLGQVVQCNPDVGLVCHNRDQEGKFQMCFNYEVRVLCCEPRADCPLTSVTPYVTSPTKHSPTTESASTVSTVTSRSSAVPSPSVCYCSVSDKLYPAGSIIYQQTDLSGHCYYAVCSLDCHVVRQTDQACPTSVPPPTTATSPPGSTPSTPVLVTTQGCPNAVPPRTKGETWAMPNCSQATCEGNNIITLQPRLCPPVQEPTCANGYPAVKVADEDGCCLHYQCQCVCSGWGDPHYITFDGTYYTFLDNCTYVLVQQVVPVYGHFRVLIDNYFCDAEDGLSCPQSIIVEYRQDRIVLTRKAVRGVMTNEIIFNSKVVSSGFQKHGVVISQIGIKMYVTIPEIGVQVMFSGLIFSVQVPFSKFANNTEGQCGTCTNDQKDECRLPGGAVVTSCSDMSSYWKVTNPSQPSCHGPPATPAAAGPTTPPAPCPPAPICQLILSEVFKMCHAVIPPMPYYQGCVFDQCHMTTRSDVVCSSLELYASLCASHGVCIDWRGRTNHTCPFTCPADKVYRPCGPSNPTSCYSTDSDSASLVVLQDAGLVTEGCFCPEGMTLFSKNVDVCVPTGCPRCLGPQGEPVEPGHTVNIDCQECTCEGSPWTLRCRRQPCSLPPACPEPGFVPVPVAPQAGQCCPQYRCVCNASYCPPPADCPQGSRQVLTYQEGSCCPSQKCSWTVCSVNGTLYQPGAVVSSSLCETCTCQVPGIPQADRFMIHCETQTCNTHCPVGFEYQAQSGQCCGLCVQVACVMNTSDSSAHLFYPGESWSDPGNPCVTHECEKHQDGLVVVTTKQACPPLSCPADQARLSEDGCCLSCPPITPQPQSTCAVHYQHQVIRLQGCSSTGPVRLAYCQGNCGDTASMYSLEANMVQHRCSCCQELQASPRNVTLSCADGSRRAFSYTQAEKCGCVGLRCNPHGDPGRVQGQEPEHGQRSRRARAPPLA